MKILITGGNSFIGKNLFEHFNGQYSVVSPAKNSLDLLESAKVFNYIQSNHFDIVIHTATYDAAPRFSTKDSSKVLENNLKMFFNISRCSDYFGKMIYFGSGAEFDRENWMPLMKETYFDQHIPQDQYGFSKYVMAKYAQSSKNIYNLRLFAVFGKYEDWRVRFISNVCCNAVFDLPIIINQNSNFDFLYIDDLIKAIKWFIDNKPRQHIYNVCSGKAINFKTIAEKVVAFSGKRLAIVIKNEKLEREYSGDNSLLLSEIKGFKFSPMDVSIRKLYEWYESNKQNIDKDKLQVDWRR
jgi:GDP-L-fucose synthase